MDKMPEAIELPPLPINASRIRVGISGEAISNIINNVYHDVGQTLRTDITNILMLAANASNNGSDTIKINIPHHLPRNVCESLTRLFKDAGFFATITPAFNNDYITVASITWSVSDVAAGYTTGSTSGDPEHCPCCMSSSVMDEYNTLIKKGQIKAHAKIAKDIFSRCENFDELAAVLVYNIKLLPEHERDALALLIERIEEI